MEPDCTPVERPPSPRTFVVVGYDVGRRARAVVCTYRAGEQDPRMRLYAATQGSDDTRYDDVD